MKAIMVRSTPYFVKSVEELFEYVLLLRKQEVKGKKLEGAG